MSDIIVYFNVNLKLLTKLINSAFVGILLTQYCAANINEKNEMGWACGVYG